MPPRNRHSVQQPPRNDLKEISDELHEHIAVLASDEFAGRAPASKEEILTTSYIADQFKALGLAPGNGDSYLQEVQVTESITDANTALQVKGASFAAQFKYGEQVRRRSPTRFSGTSHGRPQGQHQPAKQHSRPGVSQCNRPCPRQHSPRDEYDPSWDLSGGALDLILYFDVGLRLATENRYPNWYEGNEFRAIRDASASARGE